MGDFVPHLMLLARLKAAIHQWKHWNFLHGHDICRVYRCFGFDTQAIFCSCGIEFGKNRSGLSIAQLLRMRSKAIERGWKSK